MNSTGRKGAANELLVCADLIRLGFDVYRAVGPAAPFDLVAHQDGECHRVEVRSAMLRADGSLSPSCKQSDVCDIYAFVHGNLIHYVLASDVPDLYRLRRGGHPFPFSDVQDAA